MSFIEKLKSVGSRESSNNTASGREKESDARSTRTLSRINSGDESSESNIQLNEAGAPIEKESPLGHHINYLTLVYMTVSGVIGTGIFSTPGTILKQIGSVGASYVLWVVGFIIASFRLMIYIEYIQYFPSRAGGDVAYLEQAYPEPQFLIPTTFAAVNVIFSYLNSSAIAFGQYILKAADVKVTDWKQRGIATAVLAFTCLLASLSTRWSLRLSNWIGHAKIISLLFIAITGFVVLGGGTSVKNPKANFHNAWEGTTKGAGASQIAQAILKVSFAYGGLQYPVSVVNELPPAIRKKGYTVLVPATLFAIFVLYILCVTAYFAGAGSVAEIKKSGVLTASLFFQNVFKTKAATRALSVLVALSAYGHLIPAVIAHSRSLRECGRQGVLPFKKFWVATNWHGLDAPGPILATFIVNTIVSICIPAGSAYNFIITLGSYSGYIFDLQLSLGLIFLRRQRKRAGIDDSRHFKVPLPFLVIQQLYQCFVIIMPFVPPKDSKGKFTTKDPDLGFFYASYIVTAIGLLTLCFIYYVLWQFVFPKMYGYRHRVERYRLENGELGNRVISVKVEDLEEWDKTHGKGFKLSDIPDEYELSNVDEDDAGVVSVIHQPKV